MFGKTSLRTLVPPTAEPIHLDEAKDFCRITTNDEDALVSSLIAAARQEAETFTRRCLVMQTLELALDAFPVHRAITLPRPPLLSFDSLQYRDAAGDMQTWSADEYQVDTRMTPARVFKGYAYAWPIIRGAEDLASVILTYRAGYEVPMSADANTDKLSCVNHPYVNGDRVRLRNTGGALPGGLAANTDYFVVNKATDDIELAATSGGSKIDLTSAGTGQTFVAPAHHGVLPDQMKMAMLQSISHWYENREPVISGTIVALMPQVSRMLLWPYRVITW